MFIFNLFGPVLKYRLEVFDYCNKNIRDYVIIMTDKKSYKHYKDFHDKYEFVFIEDVKDRHELSLKYELIPSHFENEKEHIKNLVSFYRNKNTNYPYDINRFCMYFMAERGINNYCIIDSDTTIINDVEKVENFFNSIPYCSTYAPFYSFEISQPILKLISK